MKGLFNQRPLKGGNTLLVNVPAASIYDEVSSFLNKGCCGKGGAACCQEITGDAYTSTGETWIGIRQIAKIELMYPGDIAADDR